MAKHWLRWALVGSTVTLASCGGSAFSSNSGTAGSTTPIASGGDQLLIQPIQVCDDSGNGCAQVEFFQAIVEKVWAQAGLQVTFLPLNQLNDATYLDVDNDEFSDLSFSGAAGAFGRHPSSTRDSGPINVWFVDDINSSSNRSLVQFGNAWVDANGIVISDAILTFGTNGRTDVLAHEIGHNLGLRHDNFGAGGANNVMTAGSRRAIPDSVDDVFPNGARLDQLTSAQIRQVLTSGLLTTAAGVASAASSGDIGSDISKIGAVPDLQADRVAVDPQPVAAALSQVAATVPASVPVTEREATVEPAVLAADSATTVPEPAVSAGMWLGVGLLGIWKGRKSVGKQREW